MKLSKIMAAAWEMYHAGEIKTRAQFGICLKVAWAEAKAAESWQMSGDQQAELLVKMAWYTAKKGRAEGNPETGWIKTRDDAESVAGEAFTILPHIRERFPDRPFVFCAVIAAARAAQRIYRAEIKHATAIRYEATEVDGGRAAAIDIYATAAGEAAPSPEPAAIMRDTIRRALAECSEEERQTLILTAEGYTIREIAERTGRSKSAVGRDLEKVRARAGKSGLQAGA